MNNKSIWIIVIVAVVIALAVGVYLSRRKEQSAPISESVPTSVPSNGEVAPPITNGSAPEKFKLLGEEDFEATISNFNFYPSVITIKKGATVTWTNMDPAVHDVVSTDGKLSKFKSDRLNTGDKYSFTFESAGSFAYFCSIHPAMTGTVVVE